MIADVVNQLYEHLLLAGSAIAVGVYAVVFFAS